MPGTRKRRRKTVVRVPRDTTTLVEYDRADCPEGLATRRQLRERELRPGGQTPVAVLCCRVCANRPQWSCRHPTRGFLLRVDLAKPKRIPSLAQEWALDRAMAARSTCPQSKRRYWFCLPLRTQGSCDPCARGLRAQLRHLRHSCGHPGTPAGRVTPPDSRVGRRRQAQPPR
ncbi:RRQRL motif-containing zinc-binding protein [Streptomyces sp. NPDC087440]|uniref:RRQRL motif-containing zinc-binding protein n=1 Tax=Streptomyces sp. NPDC087440 TaxID=3365790 RepID=UPI0037FEC590